MSNPPEPASVVHAAPVPRDRCGMALATELLGDRWTMLILREAFYGVARFDDLRADLGAPRGILSARLRALVEAGVLERHPYREGKARVRHEYRLSAAGMELALVLIALMDWGDRHLQAGRASLELTSRETGEPVRLAPVTPAGKPVAWDQVVYTVPEA